MLIKEFLWVGIGGFLGSGMRYLIGKGIQYSLTTHLPLATFLANIIGCLLFGYITETANLHGRMSPQLQLLLTTGFCGGLTTFSTFIHENHGYVQRNAFLSLSLYMILSLIFGLAAIFLGHFIAKWQG